MQVIKSKFYFLAIFSIFILIFSLGNKAEPLRAQSGGTVALSSSCVTSCQVGTSLTVTASINAVGSMIGAVEINLNYDKAKLTFQNITHFSDANDFSDVFSEKADQSVGAIHVEAGKQSGLAIGSSGRVFAATFAVIATGNASFSVAPLDAANQDGRVTLTADSLNVSLVNATDSSNSGSMATGGGTGSDNSNSNSTTNNKKSTTTSKIVVIDYSKSEVSFDKLIVLPDGKDRTCASILIKKSGKIATNVKPTLKTEGGLDLSAITLNSDRWSVCASSSVAGSKRILISVGGTLLKDQNVSFTVPFATQAEVTGKTLPTQTTANLANVLIRRLKNVTGKAEIANKNDIFNRKNITEIDIVKLTGKADSGVKLMIYVHSPVLIQKEVTVGPDGKWSVSLDQRLTTGAHRVEAAVIDKYGTESDPKLIARFTVVKSYFTPIIIALFSFLALLSAIVFYVFYRKRKMAISSQVQPSSAMNLELVTPSVQLPQNQITLDDSIARPAKQENTGQPVNESSAVLPPSPEAIAVKQEVSSRPSQEIGVTVGVRNETPNPVLPINQSNQVIPPAPEDTQNESS